jgi:endonuclease/exonuclease/phosphatase family metal-dependent hydrolase
MNSATQKGVITTFVALLLCILALSNDVLALVNPRGTDTTFEVLTWNVHEFPGTGFRTIDTLAVLILDLDVDMIALQEIEDTIAFERLLDTLSVRDTLTDWDGVFAPFDYYYEGIPYMKTAVIWRTDRATVNYIEQLFIGYEFQFPRPPIHVYATANFGQDQFDFHLINMHLKAGSTQNDEDRRRAGILMLKAYLDNTVPDAPDQDWLVVGDWNDELDDPQGDNVFWPLLTDSTDYRFLTLPMAGDPYWASYPSFNSLIDHIMITSDANNEYANGATITLRLDDEYSNYRYRISDHRPVMSMFMGYPTSVEEDVHLPESTELLEVYPNPFNSSATIIVNLQAPTPLKLDIYNLLGEKVETLSDGPFLTGKRRINVDASQWPSGIYFAVVTTDQFRSTAKMTLIK